MTGNDLQQQLERHGLSLTDWAKRTGYTRRQLQNHVGRGGKELPAKASRLHALLLAALPEEVA